MTVKSHSQETLPPFMQQVCISPCWETSLLLTTWFQWFFPKRLGSCHLPHPMAHCSRAGTSKQAASPSTAQTQPLPGLSTWHDTRNKQIWQAICPVPSRYTHPTTIVPRLRLCFSPLRAWNFVEVVVISVGIHAAALISLHLPVLSPANDMLFKNFGGRGEREILRLRIGMLDWTIFKSETLSSHFPSQRSIKMVNFQIHPYWSLQAVEKTPFLTLFTSLTLHSTCGCRWLSRSGSLWSSLGTDKAFPKMSLCDCGRRTVSDYCQSLNRVWKIFKCMLICFVYLDFFIIWIVLSSPFLCRYKQCMWVGLRTNVDSSPLLSEQISFLYLFAVIPSWEL